MLLNDVWSCYEGYLVRNSAIWQLRFHLILILRLLNLAAFGSR